MKAFRSFSGCRAFTLVEVLVTMMVFIILAGAVFGIISGVLTSAATLQENQNRRDEITALQEFLRMKLTNLSGRDEVFTYRRGNGEGLVPNGIVIGTSTQAIALDAKIQANGYYTLRETGSFVSASGNLSSAQMLAQEIIRDDSSVAWRPLIQDVQRIEWKFQGTGAPDWMSEWITSAMKPNLVEFSLQLAGDLQPDVMNFWLPPVHTAVLPASGT